MRKISKFFRKKILRLVPWLIGLGIAVWVAGFFFIRAAAASQISELCNGAAVYVESGRFTGFGGIRLKGVLVADTTQALAETPIFRFDYIQVRFDPWKLLRGKMEVTSVRLSDFIFHASYDPQQRWNFLALMEPEAEAATPTGAIPLIEIRNGAVRISRVADQRRQAITTFSLNGRIAAQKGQNAYHFSLETDGRFGFGGSRLTGVFAPGSGREKSRLGLEGCIHMPKTKLFENSWDLDDIRLACDFDTQQVHLQRCEFSLGQGRFDLQGDLRKTADAGRTMDLTVQFDRFELSETYRKNAIVYSEPILAFADATLRQTLARLHPVGTGDLKLAVSGRPGDLSSLQLTGTLLCRDMSIVDETFPYRLDQIQGAIEFSGQQLSLNNLTANHETVELQIDGAIHNPGPQSAMDIRITSANMQFDRDLYDALDESQKKIWYTFSPKGTTGIDYHYRQLENGDEDVTLQLHFKQTGLVYEHFPYPLENLTGTVEIKPDSVTLDTVVSRYDDGRRVTLNGTVENVGAPHPAYNIHIMADRIPVDKTLIEAMPPSQRKLFDQLELDAAAYIDVTIFPHEDPERVWDFQAGVELDGQRLVYEGFKLPVEDVHLQAVVTPNQVELDAFEGTTACGTVVMNGTLTPAGLDANRPGACLSVQLEDFDFNDTFWEAAGDAADLILKQLRIQGRLDVAGDFAVNTFDPSCGTDLAIRCSDNPVFWNETVLGRASGGLRVTDDVIVLEVFRLADVRLESLPADLLQGRLAGLYDGIEPRGTVQVQVDAGTVVLDGHGPQAISLEGGIGLTGISAGHQQTLHDLTGRIDGRFEMDRPSSRWRALADCHLNQFYYHDWRVSDFDGDFAYDPNTRHFEATQVEASLYGGRVQGAIEIDLSSSEKTAYTLFVEAGDVDLPQLMGADRPDTPNPVSQGLASGTLRLKGDLREPEKSQGEAAIQVANMQLGRQSTMGKILTAMQFKKPEDHIFTELTARARIAQSQVVIEDVRMVGKPLVFRGTGTLDFPQGQISMDWVAYDRLMGSEDTFFDLLARGIGSAIWKVEVRGDLNDPQITTVFLSVLKQPLELFKKES